MIKKFAKVHPNSLKNLRMITSPEMAREYQKKSTESQNRDREAIKALQEEFNCSARAVRQVLENVDIKAVEVLRMSMMDSLNKQNYEDAARYASQLAEYEQAKLARVEQTNVSKVEDLTDEQLQEILKQEGLS